MTPKLTLTRQQAASDQRTATIFRKVHQITYQERLYSKTDARVAVASKSALAACQPVAAHSDNSPAFQPSTSEVPTDVASALSELSTLRSEMAAMQAALGVLKGDKAPSAMGNLRPRTPTKAALMARAHALRCGQAGRQQPVSPGNQADPAAAKSDAVKGLIASSPQEQLRQKLIDEPLLEYQEQYNEDPVQPATREDALALRNLLANSLPLGSIQAKVNEQWGLRPKQEGARVLSDLHLLQRDYQLLTMVHGEAVKQVAAWCSEEASVLTGLRERYMELFGVMLSNSAEAQRLCSNMAEAKRQADKFLRSREKAVVHLQQQLLKKNDELEQLKTSHGLLQNMLDSTKESTSADIAHLTAVTKAQQERALELSSALSEIQESHAQQMSQLSRTTSAHMAQATQANQELRSRTEYLDRQLEKAKIRPHRVVPTTEAEVQTEPMEAPPPPPEIFEAPSQAPTPGAPKKKSKVWMGNFVDLFTSKPIPVGRPHSKAWILKVVGQMWADKCAQDVADPAQNAGKTFCQWVYDWHIHRFGLTKLAEINLADLIKSVQTSWKENSKVAHFGQLTAIVQSRNLLRWVAQEDYEFYQMLLSNTAMACQPSSILTLFTDAEVSPNLRVTPAIDTVKAVFKHLEDPEGCREFFATTFESLQDAKAGTIPAEPFMQALLEQYLKRVSVNRSTLMALFAAGDSDNDGLLDRPQAKAALLCAQPSITDTVTTTIWLEREKYAMAEALTKDAVDGEALVDAARTHGLGMWKLDCRSFGEAQLATTTGWRPCTPTGPFRDTLFQQLTDAAANCKPDLAEQVKHLRTKLPSSARKDGVALEAQLNHFHHMLEEGQDAEAAYLAEQLLISHMHYLITMYVSDSPPVVDPYAASALRCSSRPTSPQVAPGGLRGTAPLQSAESSARWAAAALRGSSRPQGRASPGSAFAAAHGAGFAAAAAKVAAMTAFGIPSSPEATLPPLPPPSRSSIGSRDSHRSANLLLL